MSTTTVDVAAQLTSLKQKIADADRNRTTAEAHKAMAQKRLDEINEQITALGIDPAKAEDELVKMEAKLAKEIAAIDAALVKEQEAYAAILQAAK